MPDDGRWLDWVKALPLEERLVLPDGTRVLCVHASPGEDDGTGITPSQTHEELEHLLESCEAELVLVGHTHWPLDRSAAGVRVINPGSVSYPWFPDLRGSYALIEADASGHTITQHRVEFDIGAVIESIWDSGFYPHPEWLVQRYTNQRRAPWDQP